MATNDFVPFAPVAGANIIDLATYQGSGQVSGGFSAGVAQSAYANRALRQASAIGAMIAQWICDTLDADVVDGDGALSSAALEAQFISALQASGRIRLNARLSLYVAPTGNDSNPGTSSLPFLTLQAAWNYILNNIDTHGFGVQVNVADGTYASVECSGQLVGGGSVAWEGDVTTPANCIISGSNVHAFSATAGAAITVAGFTLIATGTLPNGGGGLVASSSGSIQITGAINFAACSGAHIYSSGAGIIQNNGISYTISAASPAHMICSNGLLDMTGSLEITLTAAFNFSNAFAVCNLVGLLQIYGGVSYVGAGVAGATGDRYVVDSNSVINTNGGSATFFPGNAAGIKENGGQYL